LQSVAHGNKKENKEMNAPRRKELQAIHNLITEARDRLMVVKDDEEEYLFNMPENLQNSERYTNTEEMVESLEECLDELDTILETIEEVTQ
jgi:hypothetical protein